MTERWKIHVRRKDKTLDFSWYIKDADCDANHMDIEVVPARLLDEARDRLEKARVMALDLAMDSQPCSVLGGCGTCRRCRNLKRYYIVFGDEPNA